MLNDLGLLLGHLHGSSLIARRRWYLTSLALVCAKFLLLYAQIEALRRQRAGEGHARELMIFAASCGVWFLCQRSLWRHTASALGENTRRLSGRIVDGLMRLPLDRFEAIGRDTITLRLTGDGQRVAAATYPLISLSQSAVRMALGAAYASWLAPDAAWVVVGAMALMALLVVGQIGPMRAGFAASAAAETRLYGQLRGLVGGAVLVRLHGPRMRALRAAITATSSRLRTLRVDVMTRFFGQRYASTALLYAILGFNVFVLPLAIEADLQVIREINWLVVWVVSSVIGIVFALPELARAAAALRRMRTLDTRIAGDGLEDPTLSSGRFADMRRIELEGLEYTYRDTDRRGGFAIGPIDVGFERGEVVFVTGRNGSGKSTFLKALTGLYPATGGCIRVDGVPVDGSTLTDYRALFATIFTDHHLFERVGDLDAGAEARADERLAAMGIAHATRIVDGRVTERDLSTGQKKRLAMVLAELQGRPVLLLDEWAADQDPGFRAAFYHHLLPALRDQGRLVIAVSHDDQYFHCADRVLHFEDGRLVEAPLPPAPLGSAGAVDPAGAGGSTDRPRPPPGRSRPSVRPASRAGPGGSVLYGLLRRYRTGALGRPIALAALGGVLGAALVSVVNTDMALALEGSLLAAAGFAAALGLMLWCNRTSSARAIGLFEDVQRGLREELAEGLARAPLRAVEQRRDAHGRLFGDLVYLTMAVTPQVSLIQHGAVIASVTVILALLSLEALAIWLLTVGLIAGRLLPRIRALRATRRALSTSGQALHGALEELLAGFKQLKLDPVAGGAMAAEVKRLDREITAGRIRAEAYKDASMSSANLLFYGVGLGLPLFASPSTLGLGPDLTYQVVILLSLTLGSLYGLLQAVPALGQAETTARVVVDALDELATTPAEAPGEPGGRVERIEWRRLRFAYGGDQGFAVGPVSLDLEPGRLVMVTGRNGAGKTTLMKMLCGLYPTAGRIVWDGRTVTGPRWSTYRGLFTVVVSGQHLFDRLYGIDVPRERVDRLLVRLGIDDVVGYDGTTFGDLSLSSGQRMRLALAVALLEDRPVCIFDEWTANQDPEATRFYHDTLLPELLAAGRAVIAVSHDDRYFDRADQILELGDGRLRIDPGGQAPPG